MRKIISIGESCLEVLFRGVDNSDVNRRTCQAAANANGFVESAPPDCFKNIHITQIAFCVSSHIRAVEICVGEYCLILFTVDCALYRA